MAALRRAALACCDLVTSWSISSTISTVSSLAHAGPLLLPLPAPLVAPGPAPPLLYSSSRCCSADAGEACRPVSAWPRRSRLPLATLLAEGLKVGLQARAL